jgi:hypothetical protein
MISAVRERQEHIVAVLILPAWSWMLLGGLSVLGVTDTSRTDVFTWFPLVPHLAAAWWVVVLLVALVVCMTEKSYRLKTTANNLTERPAMPRSIGGGEGGLGGAATAMGLDAWGKADGGRGGLLNGEPSGGAGGGGEARGLFVHIQGGRGGNAPTPDGRGGRAGIGSMEKACAAERNRKVA